MYCNIKRTRERQTSLRSHHKGSPSSSFAMPETSSSSRKGSVVGITFLFSCSKQQQPTAYCWRSIRTGKSNDCGNDFLSTEQQQQQHRKEKKLLFECRKNSGWIVTSLKKWRNKKRKWAPSQPFATTAKPTTFFFLGHCFARWHKTSGSYGFLTRTAGSKRKQMYYYGKSRQDKN